MLLPAQFRMRCSQYLTSARPIQNLDHLKGRNEAHRKSLDALSAPGRHIFIYGARGVGKTSLARTAVRSAQPHVPQPKLIACDRKSSFDSLFADLMRGILSLNPLSKDKNWKVGGGLTIFGTGGNLNLEKQASKQDFSVTSVNEAISFVRAALDQIGGEHIIIIDEFEFFQDREDHQRFASFLKQLSEQSLPLKIVVCGIADSIDGVFAAHESVHRCIHAEKLDRLKLGARIEIVNEASLALQIGVPDYLTYRIAQTSDGFPYYIHLLCEKMFSIAFSAEKDVVDQDVFANAVRETIVSIEPKLKRPYDDSVKKNTKNAEPILWAVANDDLLEVQTSTIWRNYEKICMELRCETVTKNNMSTKLNNLTKSSHGELLTKPRRSYFAFNETMLRGYARLEALRAGICLGPENPGA